MKIDRLKLINFRNYKELDIFFDKETNIFFGDNAQGKTNILEAIYILSTTKSLRGALDKEMVKFNEKESFIHGYFVDDEISLKLDIELNKSKGKKAFINNIPAKKLNELVGLVNIIVFSPEDLNIIKSSPGKRRSFMDIELCQISKIYMNNLSYYKKILENRNKLLKEISISKDKKLIETLDIWDIQLAKYGSEIIKERKKFLKQINEIAINLHKKITNNEEEIKIIYSMNVDENSFYDELKKNRNKDIKTTITNIGPHRDDIEFFINDIEVKSYGSQGQQRTVALVLKLSEIKMVKDIFNKDAILLLDDVLSELDRKRQTILLDMVNSSQTFITCTGMEEFIESKIENKKIYKVTNGSVEEIRR